MIQVTRTGRGDGLLVMPCQSLHIGALSIIWFVRRVAHGESGRKCEREFCGVRREKRRGRGRGGDAQVPGRGRGHRDRDAEQPRGAPGARRRPAHSQQHSRAEARPERQTGTLKIFPVTTRKYFPVFKKYFPSIQIFSVTQKYFPIFDENNWCILYLLKKNCRLNVLAPRQSRKAGWFILRTKITCESDITGDSTPSQSRCLRLGSS